MVLIKNERILALLWYITIKRENLNSVNQIQYNKVQTEVWVFSIILILFIVIHLIFFFVPNCFVFNVQCFLVCSKVFVYCMVNNTRPYNLHKLKTLYDYVYSLSSKKCFSRTFYFKKIMIRDMRVKNQEFKKQIFDNNFLNLIQILFCFRILDNLTLIDFFWLVLVFCNNIIQEI